MLRRSIYFDNKENNLWKIVVITHCAMRIHRSEPKFPTISSYLVSWLKCFLSTILLFSITFLVKT